MFDVLMKVPNLNSNTMKSISVTLKKYTYHSNDQGYC